MYSERGLFWREYGHTFDSQNFGLYYLFGVGIPSILTAKSDNHDFEWYETQTNRWA